MSNVPAPEGKHQAANRKRDKIIRGAKPTSEPSPEYEQALSVMEAYLRQHHKRTTVERRFVLQTLYQLSAPIDVQTLHQLVCDGAGIVAMGTVYNTLELLLELHLVKRLELVSNKMAFYERALGQDSHGYAVCDQCGAIAVIRNAELLQSITQSLPRGFVADDYVLQIHGTCAKCTGRRKKKKNIQTKK